MKLIFQDLFIHLGNKEALDVFPMMMTALTPRHLLVSPSDAGPSTSSAS